MPRKKQPIDPDAACSHCQGKPVKNLGLCRACYNLYARRCRHLREGKPLTPDLIAGPGYRRPDDYQPKWMTDKKAGAKSAERGATNKYGKIPAWQFERHAMSGLFNADERPEVIDAMIRGDFKSFMKYTERKHYDEQ
jgi:hypothetical protein